MSPGRLLLLLHAVCLCAALADTHFLSVVQEIFDTLCQCAALNPDPVDEGATCKLWMSTVLYYYIAMSTMWMRPAQTSAFGHTSDARLFVQMTVMEVSFSIMKTRC